MTLPAARAATRVPTHVYVTMLVGITAGSLSPILGRLALGEGAPTLAVAAARMAISALVLLPFAAGQPLPRLSRRDWSLMAVSGVILAFYFTAWFESLHYISVFVGMVLVTSMPIWIAIIETVFLKARPTRLVLAGIALAFAGNIIIALASAGEAGAGSNPLLGGALALAAALAASIFRVISRSQRRHVALLPYQTVVYSSSALTLLLVCALTGTALMGYSGQAYTWMLLLALLPQLVGYSASNYAVRFLSATYVSLVIQLEVVLSALIALALFAELPSAGQVAGGVILMAGVALASLGRR